MVVAPAAGAGSPKRADDRLMSARDVVSIPGEQASYPAVPDGQRPKTVVLEFKQPRDRRRTPCGPARQPAAGINGELVSTVYLDKSRHVAHPHRVGKSLRPLTAVLRVDSGFAARLDIR